MQMIQCFRSSMTVGVLAIALAGQSICAQAVRPVSFDSPTSVQAVPGEPTSEHPDVSNTVGSISAGKTDNIDITTVSTTTLADTASQSHDAAPAAEIGSPQVVKPNPRRLHGPAASLKARLEARMANDPATKEIVAPPTEETAPIVAEDPWRLFHAPVLDRSGITVRGWVDQGITFNDDGASPYNGPVANNDLDHEYQMNQAWLSFDRAVCRDSNDGDFGGHADLFYGTDWRYDVNHGLEDRINGLNNQTYGMSIPQAYLEAGGNNLSLKLGHMFANMDVESVAGPNNFFYSHSYCFTYCVPKELTGVVADYQVADTLSCQAGFHRGWNEFEDNNDTLDFMGGFRWSSHDKRTSLAYTVTNGPQDTAGLQNRFIYNLIFQEDLTNRTQYVLEHDLGVESNVGPSGQKAMWYGVNQYYRYALNDRWATCLRAEWLRDQDGDIVAGPSANAGLRSWVGHGFAGDFFEVTAGLNWKPQANVTVRPEVRYDWYDGAQGVYGPTNLAGLPFHNGTSSSQLLSAADLIVVF